MPYTLVQDFTLFVILGEKTTDIWKQKLDWVAAKGGMGLLNGHPDYMNFGSDPYGPEEYPVRFYRDFLAHIRSLYGNHLWPVLPGDVWSLLNECFQTAKVIAA